jgi:hypothetical protein
VASKPREGERVVVMVRPSNTSSEAPVLLSASVSSLSRSWASATGREMMAEKRRSLAVRSPPWPSSRRITWASREPMTAKSERPVTFCSSWTASVLSTAVSRVSPSCGKLEVRCTSSPSGSGRKWISSSGLVTCWGACCTWPDTSGATRATTSNGAAIRSSPLRM